VEDLVGIYAVSADRNSGGAKVSQTGVNVGNCRQFGGSDKGEVAGIKEYEQPVTEKVPPVDLNFPAPVIRRRGKVRGPLLQMKALAGNASRLAA
jgi:hypothetical protein